MCLREGGMIVEGESRMPIDYQLLLKLTKEVPTGLDTSKNKEQVTGETREEVMSRDKGSCRLCRVENPDGKTKMMIHHIIPNGPATLDNLVLLCYRCHMIVHDLLWKDGKWKHLWRPPKTTYGGYW